MTPYFPYIHNFPHLNPPSQCHLWAAIYTYTIFLHKCEENAVVDRMNNNSII